MFPLGRILQCSKSPPIQLTGESDGNDYREKKETVRKSMLSRRRPQQILFNNCFHNTKEERFQPRGSFSDFGRRPGCLKTVKDKRSVWSLNAISRPAIMQGLDMLASVSLPFPRVPDSTERQYNR
jgi:hypothetical protein